MSSDDTTSNNQNENKSESPKEERIDTLKDRMKVDYSYPETNDPNFQYKIYKKREFYYHKIPSRPIITDYNDIKEYRDNICGRHFTLHEHQAMLGNFINPNTPYRGVILYHGLGSGKCIDKTSRVYVNTNIKIIEDIWFQYKTSVSVDNEGGEWSIPCNTLMVDSLDENNKLCKRPITRLYREHVNTTLKKIYLENGSSVTITLIHKLLSTTGWTNSLKVGDMIRINTNDDYSKIKFIDYVFYNDYVYDLEISDTHNYVAEGIFCHNTCAAITIAEKFKDMVHKYNTKIYVLVPGPLIRENWKAELLKCTGETYKKYVDKSAVIDAAEEDRLNKLAIGQAMQYYKFMTYKGFYRRVLGEKIVDKKVVKGEKTKAVYRKTEEGEFERDVAVDRLYNLNNSIIIVDEAHGLTGNNYGEALRYIIKNSINLRIVLLSATPMKNLADDIIELLNFVRPPSAPIERDRIFTTDKIDKMQIKEGGLEYLKNMAQGYVSHVRGADPLTYAKRVDKGVVPKGLSFVKVIQCKMLPFQLKAYNTAVRHAEDSLDRKSEAVANFAYPGLHQETKELIGYYGREGVGIIKNQLKSSYDTLNKKIAMEIFKDKDESDLLYLAEDGSTVTGKILGIDYIKHFSTKFYKMLKKIGRLIWGKKGSKTAFIYSNLVKVGIELIQQVLIQNGYLEYREDGNYQISHNTKCYFCGKIYGEHGTKRSNLMREESDSDSDNDPGEILSSKISEIKYKRTESSTDYENYKGHMITKELPEHEFKPTIFIPVTGGSGDETAEYIPEEKQKILRDIFSSTSNKDGRHIKFVLGSKVMNEGISLKNVGEVHIMDVHFNLGKVDQTVGRAIRYCSNYSLMYESNKFPLVNVYKYVITLEKGLSTEEELYQKAESKYTLIKKVERALKEVAIDCPLNIHGNMFREEMEQHKNCGEPGHDPCPTICDYTKCDYKCEGKILNNEFYDPARKIYKKIAKDNLDYSTFTNSLARDEIEYTKLKIKELYMKKHVYTLESVIEYVKGTYDKEHRDLFDEFFVFKGLDELIPITENDFNNFRDTVLDKYNRPGYLIYINKYYIFQPFDQNEDVPMYYRTTFDKKVYKQLSLYNYLKNMDKYIEFKKFGRKTDNETDEDEDIEKEVSGYDFDSVMDYYDNRDEYKYVGIIDKELSRRKSKQPDEIKDVFKIREKRSKILEKKRGTGISSIFGAVCATSKNQRFLQQLVKELGLTYKNEHTRFELCEIIKNKLIELEKFSVGKEKLTYIMIPADHPEFVFPMNLQDRVEFIQLKIKESIKFNLNVKVTTKKRTIDPYKGKILYEIIIKNESKLKDFESVFTEFGGKLVENNWIITVD